MYGKVVYGGVMEGGRGVGRLCGGPRGPGGGHGWGERAREGMKGTE